MLFNSVVYMLSQRLYMKASHRNVSRYTRGGGLPQSRIIFHKKSIGLHVILYPRLLKF